MNQMQYLWIEFCASFLLWFLYLGLAILWVIDGKIKKEQVIHALFASLTASLASSLIKHFFPTIRPFLVNGKDALVLMTPTDGAFPSAHTATAFAISVTIFLHDRKPGWLFLLAAIVIGGSRVLANVHYPADILGGALIGTLTAVVVEKIHLFQLLTRSKRS